jgi:hypothetical protein
MNITLHIFVTLYLLLTVWGSNTPGKPSIHDYSQCDGLTDHLSRVHCQSAVTFYNGTIQKNAYNIVYNGAPLPLVLHPDVLGKVHPTFSAIPGLTMNQTIEYFWGLTANIAFGYAVGNVLIQNFMNNDDRCYFKAILQWYDDQGNVNNYTLLTTFRFDTVEIDKIIEFEVWAINGVLFTRQAGFDTRIPALQEAFIELTCNTIIQACYGANQVYDNYTDCMDFMHSISFDDGGMLCTNTVQCRQFHSSIAIINEHFANDHCNHTSRSGGGKCVDITNAQSFMPVFNTNPRLIF